jgi:hypothetical protein
MSNPTPAIAKSDSPTDACSTVKFNVGGRLYEVSRSLIEKFPSTVLARMTSETWQKDPEATLFIDRDSDRFRFCLDYMRDGEVWLPLNAPKEGILLDLDYFGFENVDPRKIHGGSSNLAAAWQLSKCKEEHEMVLSTCTKNVKAAETTLKAAKRACTENTRAAKTTSECEEVAYDCFLRLSRGHSLENLVFPYQSNLHSNREEFEDHLAKCGLALADVRFVGHSKNGHIFTLKEKEDTIN